KVGLQVPPDLSAKQRAEIESLSKISGKEFESKYARLILEDHTNDLAAFRKAESTTQRPELKKEIAGAIPVIEHHWEMPRNCKNYVNLIILPESLFDSLRPDSTKTDWSNKAA